MDLHKTILSDRTLWFDGDSEVDEHEINRLVTLGFSTKGLFVRELNESLDRFNRLVPNEERIGVKKSVRKLNFDWNIPNEFKEINLIDYMVESLEKLSHTMSSNDWERRVKRVAQELALYQKLNLDNVLRTLIYIINTLKSKDIVWGVGRGSSVSSYVLYLIGVHDVDSVEYELEITDFLRTE